MQGLIVPEILPPELWELDAQALLQATDLPEMDCLDQLFSQVPCPDEIQVEPHCSSERELQDGGPGETSSAVSTRFANPVGDDDVKAVHS